MKVWWSYSNYGWTTDKRARHDEDAFKCVSYVRYMVLRIAERMANWAAYTTLPRVY